MTSTPKFSTDHCSSSGNDEDKDPDLLNSSNQMVYYDDDDYGGLGDEFVMDSAEMGPDGVIISPEEADDNEGEQADEDGNPEFAKSTLEKTILIDDSLETDAFNHQQLSPLKKSPRHASDSSAGPVPLVSASGLSPFKRLSFGRTVETVAEPVKRAGKSAPLGPVRINLAELSDPLLPPKQKFIQDEFFGVYCLVSKSQEKCYKNRCYIGFTVDPNRRIRQHNAGRQAGGAKKTDNRGPWDMVCIVHGFPNAISALRFEWAWQNPKKSRRLKGLVLSKSRKESPFGFCFRIVCHMLRSAPWRELALTFRWLIQDYELPFPLDLDLPAHMKVAYGKVQKVNVAVPTELHEYTTLRDCNLCRKAIAGIAQLLRCPATEICGVHFHVRCLAEHCLRSQNLLLKRLVPIDGRCPKCAVDFLWGDLIRDQRTLLLLEDAKPEAEGTRIAGGMIPRRVVKS